MNIMKALTNSQIVSVYTLNESGVTKAQLSRDYGVNVKSITRAIEIASEIRDIASRKVEVKLEEKVLQRPTKKIMIVVPKKRKAEPRQRAPINSAMADAFMAARK
ncbi:MAG: hypothetical protein [Caudoviricetes sp.]|nr:MAG: hypothetical protein [Caudoviricetes sp.]